MGKHGKRNKQRAGRNRQPSESEGHEQQEGRCCHVKEAVKLSNLNNTIPHADLTSCHECEKIIFNEPSQTSDESSDQKRDESSKIDDNNVQESSKGPLEIVGRAAAIDNTKQETTENDESSTGKDIYAELAAELASAMCVCLECGFVGCSRQSQYKHALEHFNSKKLHAVVVNLHNWVVWCYLCDDELDPEVNTDLEPCLALLKKVLGVKENKPVEDFSKKQHKKTAQSNSGFCEKLVGIKGLTNLGNTCFFNSVMQNLCQIHLLRLAMNHLMLGEFSYCIQPSEKDKHLDPLSVVVSDKYGSLTQSLAKFVQDMTGDAKKHVINPGNLFSEICKKAPRFKGFRQQDSQELLRYLLDAVRTEEIKTVKRGILSSFDVKSAGSKEDVPGSIIGSETHEKIRAYGRSAGAPVIDSLFGGLLISSVECLTCYKVFSIMETFFDLSLSLATNSQVPQNNKSNKTFSKKKEAPPKVSGKNNKGKQSPKIVEKPNTERTLSKHQQNKKAQAAKKEKKKARRHKNSVSKNDSKVSEVEAGTTNNEEVAQNGETVSTATEEAEKTVPTQDEEITSKINEEVASQAEGTISSPMEEHVSAESDKVTIPQADGTVSVQTEGSVSKQTDGTVLATTEKVSTPTQTENVSDQNHVDSDRERMDDKDAHKSGKTRIEPESGLEKLCSETENEISDDINNTGLKNNEKKFESVNCKATMTNEQPDVVLESNSKKPCFGETLPSHTDNSTCNAVNNETVDQGNSEEETNFETSDREKTENVQDASIRQLCRGLGELSLSGTHPVHGTCSSSEAEGLKSEVGDRNCENAVSFAEREREHENCTREICSECDDIYAGDDKEGVPNGAKGRAKSVDCETKLTDEKAAASTGVIPDLHNKGDVKSSGDKGDINKASSLSGAHTSINITAFDEVVDTEDKDVGDVCGGVGGDVVDDDGGAVGGSNGADNVASGVGHDDHHDVDCGDDIIDNDGGRVGGGSGNGENGDDSGFGGSSGDGADNGGDSASNGDGDENHNNASSTSENENTGSQNPATSEILSWNHSLKPMDSTKNGMASIEECLKRFCTPEVLDGDNQFMCEHCNKKKASEESDEEDSDSENEDNDCDKKKEERTTYTNAVKQLLIHQPPPILTLHLKRFHQVMFSLRKLAKHIHFPVVLDIAPFCHKSSKVATDSQDNVLYSLCGVVEHSGGLHSGHYTAYCRLAKPSPNFFQTKFDNLTEFLDALKQMWTRTSAEDQRLRHEEPSRSKWFYVSDSHVSEVNEEKVLKAQAYLLFYQRMALVRESTR